MIAVALAAAVGYSAPVTSKKGVTRIGVLLNFCDESRSHRTWSAAFSFAPPVLGGSDGRAHALPVLARGSRYANLSEPPPLIGVRCVGFCKSNHLEAIHG